MVGDDPAVREDQLVATGAITEVRDRHAGYFAAEAVAHFAVDGPDQRVAGLGGRRVANLRRVPLAADQADLVTAARSPPTPP